MDSDARSPAPTSTATTTPPPMEPASAFAATGDPLAPFLAELEAIPKNELLPVNLDVDAAALRVLGATSSLRAHRAAMVEVFGEARVAPIDRLDDLARAALQSQAALRCAETPPDLEALSAEVLATRTLLIASVQGLIARKLVPAGALKDLRGTRGYMRRSFDVALLTAILTKDWDAVAPYTGLTLEEVRRAELAATELAVSTGLADARRPAAELRQRAYTLLARTYDHARRLVAYLRWNQNDAERIAPALLGYAKGRRKKARGKARDAA